MAVALPVRKPTTGIVTRFRGVNAAGYTTSVCVLYVLTFFVGSYIYTQYRTAIRIPLEAAHYYKTGGFFDFKEHVATLGLVLLPAYSWRALGLRHDGVLRDRGAGHNPRS